MADTVLLVYCVGPQVEQQGTQLETFQQRNLLLQEENNVLKEKIHNLERYSSLTDLSLKNKYIHSEATMIADNTEMGFYTFSRLRL